MLINRRLAVLVFQVARTTAQEVVVCLAKIRQKMFSRTRTWIIRACDRGDLFFNANKRLCEKHPTIVRSWKCTPEVSADHMF